MTAREKIVGWYSTGPKLREADIDINELIRQFCDSPVLVICEVQVGTCDTGVSLGNGTILGVRYTLWYARRAGVHTTTILDWPGISSSLACVDTERVVALHPLERCFQPALKHLKAAEHIPVQGESASATDTFPPLDAPSPRSPRRWASPSPPTCRWRRCARTARRRPRR